MPTDFSSRDPLPGVLEQLSHRWSPRAFVKVDIAPDVLALIFDAARFAPSCFNAQPWRFYTSSPANFDEYLALLVDANQVWAKNASAICFLVGKKQFEHNGKNNAHYAFDCGSAWMSAVLQAQHEGFHCHGMAGFHKEKSTDYLGLQGEAEDVIMAFVIGKLGDKNTLPDGYREKETPSPRKKLSDIWIKQ